MFSIKIWCFFCLTNSFLCICLCLFRLPLCRSLDRDEWLVVLRRDDDGDARQRPLDETLCDRTEIPPLGVGVVEERHVHAPLREVECGVVVQLPRHQRLPRLPHPPQHPRPRPRTHPHPTDGHWGGREREGGREGEGGREKGKREREKKN